MRYVLDLDIGTTSTVGILVLLPGTVLAIASRPATLTSRQPGWAEEDPEQLHHRALLLGTASFGADLGDLPEDLFHGFHMKAVFEKVKSRLPTGIDLEIWSECINDHYVANAGALRPIEGVLDVFSAAADMGLVQVCVSNSYRNIVDANITALGIADRLCFSISFQDVRNGKPDPEPYLTAARRLNPDPGEVIAIEDSIIGAISAHTAGMKVIGYRLSPESGRPVDHALNQYTDLPEILRRYAT